MTSIVNRFAISGVEAYLVDVEVKTITGQLLISIVGLGDTAVKEAGKELKRPLMTVNIAFLKRRLSSI